MKRQTFNCSGFTLVELMMVLVLIGIFSGLMLGEMRGSYEDALLRSTGRKIIAAVNLASSQAVTVSRSHAVWISPSENKLKVQMESQTEPIEEISLDSRITITIREPNLSADDEEQEEAVPPAKNLEKIVFQPDGTADSRDIILRDRLGVDLVLRISPVTGRIRTIESEAEK